MLYSGAPEAFHRLRSTVASGPSTWLRAVLSVPKDGFSRIVLSPPSPLTAPRWARVVDTLAVVLLILAAVVFEWGGFRSRIGGVRIAITSPYRILIGALLLIAIRHWRVPRPSIVGDLTGRWQAAKRSASTRIAALAFLGTRPAILFIGYFAVVTLGYSNNGRPPMRYDENEFMNLQGKWDTTWYMSIAIDGYRYRSANLEREQQNIAFFPALPLLTRLAGRLFGGASTAFLWGGTLVVLGAFFWGLVYLFHLARECLDEERARWVVWVAATYPFAVFFSALYTEAYYLVGAAGAFYHFRRREFVKAALWGLLVGLTRPNGCLLSIPLALIAIEPWLPAWLAGGASGRPLPGFTRTMRSLTPAILSASAAGIGMLLFSAYLWTLTGELLAWAENHAAWGRQYGGLVPLATRYYGYMAESGPYIFTKVLPFDTLNGMGAIFVIVSAYPVWRRFGLAYAVFILVNILPPLAAGGFLSTGRVSAVCFPAFFWLASIVPERQRPGWTGSFMAVQALNAALFYTWHEMF